MLEKEYQTAKKYVEKYPDNPAAWNLLGIVYMSEFRIDEADNYLQKAKVYGIPEAEHNLDILAELKKAIREYEEATDDAYE